MNDILTALKKRDDLFSLQGVSQEAVDQAESALDVVFADEFKRYLLTFGVASANGHEFTGICKSRRLNVVDVTKEERRFNPDVPHDLYVVEQANIDGIVLWQSSAGKIYQSQPNCPPVLLCNSLCELLKL